MKRLLLISNSRNYKEEYFAYCYDKVSDFIGKEIKKVLFIPYAGITDFDGYENTVQKAYEKMGYSLESVHHAENPAKAVEQAEVIFTGGGNTFFLLHSLYKYGLLEPIRKKVESGTPYIGVSAGSNIACPTIKTTNDMPVIFPPSFDSLNLIPFNINPHYLDPDPDSTHQGETREMRINEFHLINTEIVVGLRESSMLLVEGNEVTLKGSRSARIFRKDHKPEEFQPERKLSFLL